MVAMSSSNPRLYLDQWLAAATKGKILPSYSTFTNRVKLCCTSCEETLTIDVPTGTTIDSKVQAFVNFHLHRPAPNCSYCGAAVTSEAFVQHEHLCLLRPGSPGYTGASPGIPKTLDFKPVGKIDDKPEMAKKIVDATSKTLGSYSDEAVAKKLAALMADDKGKVIPFAKPKNWNDYTAYHGIPFHGTDPSGVIKGGTVSIKWTGGSNEWSPDETATDEELADLEKKAAKLKAVENALKIKQLKAMIETLKPLAEHAEPPKVKPTPIADGVMVTGRKFR